MYWNIDVTPEDEAEMIGKIAQKIHKNGLDVVAVLTMESIKPLSYVGAQMGRFLLLPFLPILGEKSSFRSSRNARTWRSSSKPLRS